MAALVDWHSAWWLLNEPNSIFRLRQLLLDWWAQHGRLAIPWKLSPDGRPASSGHALDPYPIWVAEVMLQQTQLLVVLPYWRRWMDELPSLEALAAAREHDQQLSLLEHHLRHPDGIRIEGVS